MSLRTLARSVAISSICYVAISVLVTGCSFIKLTRTETDYYTITNHDTVVTETVRNVPGTTTEGSVTAPSSRKVNTRDVTISYDSTATRNYPNFLRAGGLEIAGLIGSSSQNGVGTGLFGAYSLFDHDQIKNSGTLWNGGTGNTSYLTKGELARLMPFEWELHWFNNAPNWTFGWSAVEYIAPDEDQNHALLSIGSNVYVRRRFFLRDQIPYIIFSPFLGASAFPAAYVNLGGEFHVGSLAGLNFRAYAGLASGYWWFLPQNGSTFPYFGMGVSVFDFTNRVEETEREWKYYTHTAINLNILELALTKSASPYETNFNNSTFPFEGSRVKFASIQVPLPFANYHFWAGTSLFDWTVYGFAQQSLGVLPLEAGYRQYLFTNDLMLEPFIELCYYPSQTVNLGARLKIDTHSNFNLGITAGFAAGSPGQFTPQAFNSGAPEFGSSYSTPYVGLSLYVGDWNFTPEEIKESRANEISSKL